MQIRIAVGPRHGVALVRYLFSYKNPADPQFIQLLSKNPTKAAGLLHKGGDRYYSWSFPMKGEMGFGESMKPSKSRNKPTEKGEGALSQTQMKKTGEGSSIKRKSKVYQ